MKKINWIRFFLGGLAAAIICFVADGMLHERVLNTDWKAVYAGLGAAMPEETPGSIAYFVVFELGRGFLSILLYVLMRERLGMGPRTAAVAGIVVWIAFSLTGPAQFIPLGFYSHALWLKVGAFQLVTSVLATILAAALYKDTANG